MRQWMGSCALHGARTNSESRSTESEPRGASTLDRERSRDRGTETAFLADSTRSGLSLARSKQLQRDVESEPQRIELARSKRRFASAGCLSRARVEQAALHCRDLGKLRHSRERRRASPKTRTRRHRRARTAASSSARGRCAPGTCGVDPEKRTKSKGAGGQGREPGVGVVAAVERDGGRRARWTKAGRKNGQRLARRG